MFRLPVLDDRAETLGPEFALRRVDEPAGDRPTVGGVADLVGQYAGRRYSATAESLDGRRSGPATQAIVKLEGFRNRWRHR